MARNCFKRFEEIKVVDALRQMPTGTMSPKGITEHVSHLLGRELRWSVIRELMKDAALAIPDNPSATGRQKASRDRARILAAEMLRIQKELGMESSQAIVSMASGRLPEEDVADTNPKLEKIETPTTNQPTLFKGSLNPKDIRVGGGK